MGRMLMRMRVLLVQQVWQHEAVVKKRKQVGYVWWRVKRLFPLIPAPPHARTCAAESPDARTAGLLLAEP